MAENRIRKSDLLPKGNGYSVGVVVKSSGSDKGRVAINRDGTNTEFITPVRYRAITADLTLTAADDGNVIAFDSTTALTVTLPATRAGLKYTFVLKQLPGAGTHAISPNAVDKIFAPGFTAADGKAIVATAAADGVGDFITLVGDGVDGWYVVAIGEATPDNWARQA